MSSPQEARNEYAPLLAMLVPGYIYRLGGGAGVNDGEHGTIWSIPVWVRAPDWRHGAAFSFAQYPNSGRQAGRLVYRLRAFSAPAERSVFHMLLGAGGFWDRDDGLGPRAEVSLLLGRFGRGGGLLSFGYEYVATEHVNVIDVSVTFFVPYIIR